jgi:hypothetical protein
MTKRILITLCTTLMLASCGGDKPADDKKATDKKATDDGAKKADADVAAPEPTPPPVAVAKIDLKALKITAEGWEGEYNEALEGWTFEKYTPNADGDNDPNRFYVDFMDSDRTTDLEEYAKKLQEDQAFQDFGYLYTAIEAKEKLDNGWLITGTMKDMNDAEDKGEPSFVLYRSDKNIYCRSGAFVDAKWRTEAIDACKKM